MPRVTLTVPDHVPQPYRFPLDVHSVTIGRGDENDITVNNGSVSLRHAEMLRIPGGFELRDVGSTNGIKCNGQRLMAIPLDDGDEVSIGDVRFQFSLTAEEQAALALENKPELPELGAANVSVLKVAAAGDALPAMGPPPTAHERVLVVPSASDGVSFGTALVFLILAAGAFFAGLAVRHQKDTGANLIDSIKAKSAPAAPQGE
ncbi:MAG: FHA domain-containing protein [Verrucomicrobiota bacterium]